MGCRTCVSPLVGKFERGQVDFCQGSATNVLDPMSCVFQGLILSPQAKKKACAETVNKVQLQANFGIPYKCCVFCI